LAKAVGRYRHQHLADEPDDRNRYRGVNVLNLMAEGRDDNRWMTYKQAESLGAQVRKGERGTLVQYWQFDEKQPIKDDQGKPMLDGDGKPMHWTVQLERPRAFYAVVFNAEQIDGLAASIPAKAHD
jgi:antirestriction protein ArdC